MSRKLRSVLAAAALVAAAAQPAAAAGEDISFIRLSGEDRYGTAIAISEHAFQPEYEGDRFAVTVASARDFPDALAAGPLAAADEGPLLLVPYDGVVPQNVRAELTRLQPYMINVAGGAAAVSTLVESQLRDHSDSVYRWSGANRYATAAWLASLTGGLNDVAFIATGNSFPDALGGAAAAGRLGGGLLLTQRDALPTDTEWELEFYQPAEVVILGGHNVVSPAVEAEIRGLVPGAKIERWSGGDRYATAANISAHTYPQGANSVYLASGVTYPDALAGAPAAALAGSPLLLTAASCVPEATLAEINRLRATEVVVLGGPLAVSDAAARLTPC